MHRQQHWKEVCELSPLGALNSTDLTYISHSLADLYKPSLSDRTASCQKCGGNICNPLAKIRDYLKVACITSLVLPMH